MSDVLITGPAQGIGAEIARRLARRGDRVSLVGLEPEKLEAVSADCPGSVVFEADVTDADAMQLAVDGTVEALGGIDVVLPNAGIASYGLTRHIDPIVVERTIDVNLLGAWRTVRLALPHVIERRGYVMWTASTAAIGQMPALGVYAATKAGVEAMANSLRMEVRHHGVDVGVAYYLWIDSEMVRGVDRQDVWADLRSRVPAPFNRTYPVEDAAAAAVRGIERRSKRVFAPGWLRAPSLLRGILGPLTESGWDKHMPELEARIEADIERRGVLEVTRPVGAGGEAGFEGTQRPA